MACLVKMNCRGPTIATFLQFSLKFVIFVSLLVVCYFYFMKEAIAKFQRKATTVTERSIHIDDLGGYKCPDIVICPNPSFKPSISDLHGFKYPTRDLFNIMTPFSETYKYLFNKTPVRYLFEAFSYADDFNFKTLGITLNEGDNLLEFDDAKLSIALKKVRTTHMGVCHVMQSRNVQNWNERNEMVKVHI